MDKVWREHVPSKYPTMPLPSRTGQSHPTRVAAGIRSAEWRERPEILPCHLPPAPSSSFAALPRARACLALHRLASPRTCHLPYSTCTCTNKAGCQAVWTRLRVCARSAFQVCRPGSSFYARQYHGTLCLSICQSTRQPVHQLTGRPKAAKVGNGTTRFGLLFGRGTVSPRLPAVCTPSCSSPQQEMTEGRPFTPRTMTQLNSSA